MDAYSADVAAQKYFEMAAAKMAEARPMRESGARRAALREADDAITEGVRAWDWAKTQAKQQQEQTDG